MFFKSKHGQKAEDDANEGAKSKRGKRAKVEGAKEKQTEKEVNSFNDRAHTKDIFEYIVFSFIDRVSF